MRCARLAGSRAHCRAVVVLRSGIFEKLPAERPDDRRLLLLRDPEWVVDRPFSFGKHSLQRFPTEVLLGKTLLERRRTRENYTQLCADCDCYDVVALIDRRAAKAWRFDATPYSATICDALLHDLRRAPTCF